MGSLAVDDSLPSGSWDVHVHVFDPDRYPYVPNTYAPPPCSVSDLCAGVPTHNFVIVMSGPEGTNTALTVEAIKELESKGREGRGVVVLDLEQMVPDELQRLDKAGVRSVRFNTRRNGTTLDEQFVKCAEAIHAAGVRWSIEAAIFEVKLWHSLIPTLRQLHARYGTIFVADHLFAAQPSEVDTSEFRELLELVNEGVIVVKVSGMYRYGRDPEGSKPIVEAVLRQRDGRGGVWGSDWPYVMSSKTAPKPFYDVDIREHIKCLKEVCEKIGGGVWERLMRDNARTLYA